MVSGPAAAHTRQHGASMLQDFGKGVQVTIGGFSRFRLILVQT
ncbi:MAG: hypothetical protein QOH31_1439 [Verrucomicrobiota bacterium]|jgi:hypothetical protein